jgi:translation initiation factor 4B
MIKCHPLLTAAKKTGNKTLSLTNFLAEDKGGNAPPSYPPTKPTSSWAEETDDLDTEGEILQEKDSASELFVLLSPIR